MRLFKLFDNVLFVYLIVKVIGGLILVFFIVILLELVKEVWMLCGGFRDFCLLVGFVFLFWDDDSLVVSILGYVFLGGY